VYRLARPMAPLPARRGPLSSACCALMTAGVLLHGTPARAQIEAQPDFERKTEEGDVPAAPSMSPPRLIHRVDPSYPPAALSEGRKGVVVLRITLDEQGQVQRVDVDTSAAPDLDDAALGAACGFGFEPGRVDGQPVAAAVIYSFATRLGG